MSKHRHDEWFISGCPICPYSEHSPRPQEHCPNDGMPLIRLPGLVSSWDKLAAIKSRFTPDPVLAAIADGVRGVVHAAR